MYDILVADKIVCICVQGCIKAFVATLINNFGDTFKIEVREHIEEKDHPKEPDCTDTYPKTDTVVSSRDELESQTMITED